MSMHLDLQGKILGHLSDKRGEDKLLVDASLVSKVVLVSSYVTVSARLAPSRPTSNLQLHALASTFSTPASRHVEQNTHTRTVFVLWLRHFGCFLTLTRVRRQPQR